MKLFKVLLFLSLALISELGNTHILSHQPYGSIPSIKFPENVRQSAYSCMHARGRSFSRKIPKSYSHKGNYKLVATDNEYDEPVSNTKKNKKGRHISIIHPEYSADALSALIYAYGNRIRNCLLQSAASCYIPSCKRHILIQIFRI